MEEMRKSTANKREVNSEFSFGDSYYSNVDAGDVSKIDSFSRKNSNKKVVVIQGIGFVGIAMLTATANAKDAEGKPLYAVVGIDLPTESSLWKIRMVNEGKLPVTTTDSLLHAVFDHSFRQGNIMATADHYAYSIADIIVVSINLDFKKNTRINVKGKIDLEKFSSTMLDIAKKIKPSCLVIIESTFPPGTCEQFVLPIFKNEFIRRGLDHLKVKISYAYERVMPGKNYLKSITSNYRVFAGINEDARIGAKLFFENIIDTHNYPLTELSSITNAEMGKVLENSFRAANIAFIQEWTEFAETAGVNLFEVVEAIRKRETHKNIMFPGFGVGGYCLTKDPLLAEWGKTNLFNSSRRLNMSVKAVNINDNMPLHSVSLLEKYAGKLNKKKILLLGISYLPDIADTRFSPSEIFFRRCKRLGAQVIPHDPLVKYWPELKMKVINDLSDIKMNRVDAMVFAVKHQEYIDLNLQKIKQILKPKGFILDANNIIDDCKAALLREMGFVIVGVGKGHWNKLVKS